MHPLAGGRHLGRSDKAWGRAERQWPRPPAMDFHLRTPRASRNKEKGGEERWVRPSVALEKVTRTSTGAAMGEGTQPTLVVLPLMASSSHPCSLHPPPSAASSASQPPPPLSISRMCDGRAMKTTRGRLGTSIEVKPEAEWGRRGGGDWGREKAADWRVVWDIFFLSNRSSYHLTIRTPKSTYRAYHVQACLLAAVNKERAENERRSSPLETTHLPPPKDPTDPWGPATASQTPKTISETSKVGSDDPLSSTQHRAAVNQRRPTTRVERHYYRNYPSHRIVVPWICGDQSQSDKS
jgi:hypothetical protein